MVGTLISVTAEWAHLGKDKTDAGFRLLDCSSFLIDGGTFEDLLLRYSPGTLSLSDLPQVTISWLPGKTNHYIAMAVYYLPVDRRLDSSDREVMMTDCYCAPFDQLSAGAVSYMAMFEHIARRRLPVEPPEPIRVELTPFPPADVTTPFAKRVAATLLTSRPVCILDAGGLSYSERLSFIDTVASLLPYGMRSRLSASTWASSTYREHKLRLFFSDADRDVADKVMRWDKPGRGPIGHAYADEYLHLLDSGTLLPSLLAEEKTQVGFDYDSVTAMVDRLRKLQPSKRPPRRRAAPPAQRSKEATTVRVQQFAGSPDPPVAVRNEAEPRLALRVEASLIPLERGDGETLEIDIDKLKNYRIATPSYERKWLGKLISDKRLLHPDTPDAKISALQLRRYYGELLRLAFSYPNGPVGYQHYRELEDSAGYTRGEPLDSPLADAIKDVGADGPVRLLLQQSLSPDERRDLIPPAQIAAMIVNPAMDPVHAQIVSDMARQALSTQEKNRKPDRRAFREAMYAVNLLAVLQSRYTENPRDQYLVLYDILHFAYGDHLDRQSVYDIFASAEKPISPYVPARPTDALLAATLNLARQRDVTVAVHDFAYRRVNSSGIPQPIVTEVSKKVVRSSRRDASAQKVRQLKAPLEYDGVKPVFVLLFVLAILALGLIIWFETSR